ncbi:hypothetical protein CENSYa_0905 [Cenarchaeum symbiosum A]|uniref:Uncharacterized protein n=1 Tax=Cenarchaeum symbiosum (strain A) TaxID=414004 RepID=A0RW20_CENSY|nr:hypothetical protein CENSYa_0905 [Cenarchaeum symbiosum A]
MQILRPGAVKSVRGVNIHPVQRGPRYLPPVRSGPVAGGDLLRLAPPLEPQADAPRRHCRKQYDARDLQLCVVEQPYLVSGANKFLAGWGGRQWLPAHPLRALQGVSQAGGGRALGGIWTHFCTKDRGWL